MVLVIGCRGQSLALRHHRFIIWDSGLGLRLLYLSLGVRN
jgi:hypothetical protein